MFGHFPDTSSSGEDTTGNQSNPWTYPKLISSSKPKSRLGRRRENGNEVCSQNEKLDQINIRQWLNQNLKNKPCVTSSLLNLNGGRVKNVACKTEANDENTPSIFNELTVPPKYNSDHMHQRVPGQPLKEINGPHKPTSETVETQLNSSFCELKKDFPGNHPPVQSSVHNETESDSAYFDCGNNSSFMTATDIPRHDHETEKSADTIDCVPGANKTLFDLNYLKTPGKNLGDLPFPYSPFDPFEENVLNNEAGSMNNSSSTIDMKTVCSFERQPLAHMILNNDNMRIHNTPIGSKVKLFESENKSASLGKEPPVKKSKLNEIFSLADKQECREEHVKKDKINLKLMEKPSSGPPTKPSKQEFSSSFLKLVREPSPVGIKDITPSSQGISTLDSLDPVLSILEAKNNNIFKHPVPVSNDSENIELAADSKINKRKSESPSKQLKPTQPLFSKPAINFEQSDSRKLSSLCNKTPFPLEKPLTITPSPIEQSPETIVPCKSEDDLFKKPHLVPSRPVIQQPLPVSYKPTPLNNHQPSLMLPISTQQQNIIYVNNIPYMALSLIGKGGSSQVYQVLDTRSSKLRAIKCVNLSEVDPSIANGYLNEIATLSKLQSCSSVIRLFDHEYVQEKSVLYVVLEKGDIDFAKLIKKMSETEEISVPLIVYYWSEMLKAVKDIHDRGVVHSDLKPANFLLVEGRLKLIDFGIASSLQSDTTSVVREGALGTYNYISPEVVVHYKISKTNDIWSLGCILYNLVYGRAPFAHLVLGMRKMQAIANPHHKIDFPKTDRLIPSTISISLRWCLQREPKARPTINELLRLSECSEPMDLPLFNKINKLIDNHFQEVFPKLSTLLEDRNMLNF